MTKRSRWNTLQLDWPVIGLLCSTKDAQQTVDDQNSGIDPSCINRFIHQALQQILQSTGTERFLLTASDSAHAKMQWVSTRGLFFLRSVMPTD